MEIKYFWKLPIAKNYTFFKTIDEVIELIKQEKLLNFDLVETFIPGNLELDSLDKVATERNWIIKYTDQEHSLGVSNELFRNIMNPNFFKKYEIEIKSAYLEMIKKTKTKRLTIPKCLFSKELLNVILKKNDISVFFKDIELNNQQIEKIKKSNIEVNFITKGNLKQISKNHLWGIYTKKELQELEVLKTDLDEFQENEIDNLKYLKDNGVIMIQLGNNPFETEEDDFLKLKDILIKIDNLNKKLKVEFEIEKRSNFHIVFKDINLKNISLILYNDDYEYSYQEFVEEEKILNKLVDPIKNSNLSPLEKFLGVYNIVKNIKTYKENPNNKIESRALRYILKNEYIVCVGFATLLIELLDKVGIDSNKLYVSVDTSYDKGFTLEEKSVISNGHQRVIVSIDDLKYKVHGLYLSDPTWDNNLKKSFLNNALLPFDKMQISRRLFFYNISNPILDIHNFEEYNNQVNFLLKRELKELNQINFYNKASFNEILLLSYENVALKILTTIKCEPKYKTFLKMLNTCKIEQNYILFFTKLGHFLLTRINQYFNETTLFKANLEALKNLYSYKTNEELKQIDIITREDYTNNEKKEFPYKIVNNNKFNLDSRQKK